MDSAYSGHNKGWLILLAPSGLDQCSHFNRLALISVDIIQGGKLTLDLKKVPVTRIFYSNDQNYFLLTLWVIVGDFYCHL